jgi:chromosomal replication initiator protein
MQRLVEQILSDVPPIPGLIVLHGPSGCGKSLLVQSTLNELLRQERGLSVALLSARDLGPTKDSSVDAPTLDRLTQADLAVLEDLQFLPTAAMAAVLGVLQERDHWDRATIVTASVGPRHLAHRGEAFPTRFTSRLAAGLVIALQPFQKASRLRLLQHLAQRRQLDVPGDLLLWLAEHLTGGGRQLEGAVAQLETLSRLENGLLRTDAIRKHFEMQINELRPDAERIARHVSEYFQIDSRELLSRRRFRNVLLPRQVGMYLTRKLTGWSLQQIGDYFGGHDHSTVLHACQKIEASMQADAVFSGAVLALQTQLG